jgi:quinol monooxygenase YgiN
MIVKPGCWDELGPLMNKMIVETHKEEGCIEYDLFIDVNDETKACMIEAWESEEAFNAHLISDHHETIIPIFREKYKAGPSEITRYRHYNAK